MIRSIACVSKNWELGKKNQLLFNIPEDLKYFKEQTSGAVVIFGKRTYDSLPKKPLKHRLNIVLDSNSKSLYENEGCLTFNNKDDLLHFIELLKPIIDIYICGGGMIYKLFLEYCDEILITMVDAEDSEADTYFPNLNKDDRFVCTNIDVRSNDNYKFDFMTYKKVK